MNTPRIKRDIYDYTDLDGRVHMALMHEEGDRRMVCIVQDDGRESEPVPETDLNGTLTGPVGFDLEGAGNLMPLQPSPEKRWILMPPVVYRYMPQVHIDEFFATGRLMLSSFARFKGHTDEQRGDEQEGFNVITGRGEKFTLMATAQHGANSLVLSTSVRGGEELMHQFGCNGYFRIVDTHFFGRAIGERIEGYTDGLEGFCTYRDHHVIRKKMPAAMEGKLSLNPADDLELQKAVFAAAGLGGAEVFFSKRRQYEHQAEYRIIWNLSHEVDGSVIVECPEAIRFCEKVTGA